MLIQISAPFVHAHIWNGESKHRLHLPGLEFLERKLAPGYCGASGQEALDVVVQMQTGVVESVPAVRIAATPGPKDPNLEALPHSQWAPLTPVPGPCGGIDPDFRAPFLRLGLAPARAPPL